MAGSTDQGPPAPEPECDGGTATKCIFGPDVGRLWGSRSDKSGALQEEWRGEIQRGQSPRLCARGAARPRQLERSPAPAQAWPSPNLGPDWETAAPTWNSSHLGQLPPGTAPTWDCVPQVPPFTAPPHPSAKHPAGTRASSHKLPFCEATSTVSHDAKARCTPTPGETVLATAAPDSPFRGRLCSAGALGQLALQFRDSEFTLPRGTQLPCRRPSSV